MDFQTKYWKLESNALLKFMAIEVEQFTKKSMCCGKGKILLNFCKKVSYFL